jgi:hypothetical protein
VRCAKIPFHLLKVETGFNRRADLEFVWTVRQYLASRKLRKEKNAPARREIASVLCLASVELDMPAL